MKLVIISGRSGSGKSIALDALEDLDYYCIDNLPLSFAADLPEKLAHCKQNIAISIDARNLTGDIADLPNIIPNLREAFDCQLVFLDADTQTLLKRFSETRRKHPLTNSNTSIREALQQEKLLLSNIAEYADLCIETSRLNVRELRSLICNRINEDHTHTTLSIHFQSFGYKHGVPSDTDFIFDVRCLPNPYWKKNLQRKTGKDSEVIQYFEKFAEVQHMFDTIKDFIETWMPAFAAEKRKYLTISIGCTGGQHRSVYLVEKLQKYFSTQLSSTTIQHRDLS